MTEPLFNTNEWGNIDEVLNAPLIGVQPDEYWCSAIGLHLTFCCNLVQAICATICSGLLVVFAVGCKCCSALTTGCCSVMGSVQKGHPYYMSWTWWRYQPAMLLALIKNNKSRLGLFLYEWKIFGSGDYFWHGSGIWCWRHKQIDEILKSEQARSHSFGCIEATVPDLFASNILIFLPNGGPGTEWWVVRQAVHDMFLEKGAPSYQNRLRALRGKLEADVPNPTLEVLNDNVRLQKCVAKSIFWMMFGFWPTEEEADIFIGWRTAAALFVLPRLFQRFIFNFGIRKVKKLRRNTVGVIEQRNLQQTFIEMNDRLKQYKRPTAVKLCDEIMFVVGFAGIGGTSAAVESVAAFLQCKIPDEAPKKHIDFGGYNPASMLKAYKEDPEAYIKETCRINPPVTSATCPLAEDTEVELAGRTFNLPAGHLRQYLVSMANRDDSVFPKPSVFNPKRGNLSKSFSWNGAFGEGADENDYPRICPGRYLSLQVCSAIIGHLVSGS